jgi:putative MATE family efflux protein
MMPFMEKLGSLLTRRKPLLALIISLSLPAIGEMTLNTMLGVSDTIMISRFIGKEALAAVGFANQIVFTFIFVFSSFNTGAVALISRSLGEQNFAKLKRYAEQNVNLNLLIGILIMLLSFYFSGSLLSIFETTEEIYRDSLLYFRIILAGFIPLFLSFSFAATLRGSGNTMTPMVITGIANITNIIGNYVLILGVGPFPRLGIAGAAWATSGSRLLGMLLYIYVIYVRKSRFRLKFRFFFEKTIIRPLWKISLPGAVEQTLMQLSFLTMAVIVSRLDTVSEAAFRILIQIESLSFMPAIGLSIATATLVGKALGERDTQKAMETGYLSVAMGVVWALFIGGIFITFPRFIIGLFSTESVIIITGAAVMLFLGLNQIGLTFNIIMGGVLRGAGDTRTVMVNTVLRLWLIFIPLAYVFVINMNTGLAGVWYAEMASFAVFATLLLLRFFGRKWTMIQVEEDHSL